MWSFVGLKRNKQWIWLAPDRDSREIVGMHVGSRDRAGSEALWKSLPPVYHQCTVCYTDFWSAYERVLPQNRHRAVGEESGKTNRIERFNLKKPGPRVSSISLAQPTIWYTSPCNNHSCLFVFICGSLCAMHKFDSFVKIRLPQGILACPRGRQRVENPPRHGVGNCITSFADVRQRLRIGSTHPMARPVRPAPFKPA